MPKVSIIVPIYNVENYIRECLESLVNQTLKDIEIVCINDGSPDNSMKIVEEYAKDDNRFVILNQENHGQGYARNRGIEIATGDYVMLCDPDDWYELNACELAYNKITQNNSDITAFGMYNYFQETGERQINNKNINPLLRARNINNISLEELDTPFFVNIMCVNKIYNREFLIKNNVKYAENYNAEDKLFFVKAYISSKSISVINRPLYIYRIHCNSTSTTHKNWEDLYINDKSVIEDIILKSPRKDLFLKNYLEYTIRANIYWYNEWVKQDKSIQKSLYKHLREYFTYLDNSFDCTEINGYDQMKKIVKTAYPKMKIKEVSKCIVKNTFEITNINEQNKSHKLLKICGVKLKFRKSTKKERIFKNYEKVIKKLKKKYKKDKINIVFLSSTNAKWSYEYIYKAFENHPKFNVKVLINVYDMYAKGEFPEIDYKNDARSNYKFFADKNMSVDYAYNLEEDKYINLKKFKPDIVFYEQPWSLPEVYQIKSVSKFALTAFCGYGSQITNGTCEYSLPFYQELFAYFLDNNYIKKNLIEEHKFWGNNLFVVGQPKLDIFNEPIDKSKQIWKFQDKKRIIWAPHQSFFATSILRYGTFDWNYKFFYEYAKSHPDIEFILKPHPELKREIINHGLMTLDEMNEYFDNWEKLPNAQVYEQGGYFDMFRTSDIMITDSNSFLYEYLPTKKPLIHLINENSVGHNEFGQKIISGYYPARDLDELKEQIENILYKNQDPMLSVREKILKDDLCQPENGVADFILNFVTDKLK